MSADRPIVYSARYYFPPTQAKRMSYWHLYRINPDGTGRRQITHGPFDDTEPRWPPDGKWIAFLRHARRRSDVSGEGPSRNELTLCLVRANGGQLYRLALADKGPVYDLRWEANSRCLIATQWRESGGAFRPLLYAYPIHGGRSKPLPPEPEFAALSDGSTVRVDPKRNALVVREGNGKEIRRLPLPRLDDLAEEWETPQAFPNAPHKVLLPRQGGESTFGHYFHYCRIDLETGAIDEVATGKFLAFAPDGRRYCTIVRRDGAEYGRDKSVWVQPLEVGMLGQAKTRPLVQGLVYVVDADWRGGQRR